MSAKRTVVTVADLPRIPYAREVTAPNGEKYRVENRRPSLLCTICGETYSADPGDYWNLPAGHVLKCHRRPMRLVVRQTTYVDWAEYRAKAAEQAAANG